MKEKTQPQQKLKCDSTFLEEISDVSNENDKSLHIIAKYSN